MIAATTMPGIVKITPPVAASIRFRTSDSRLTRIPRILAQLSPRKKPILVARYRIPTSTAKTLSAKIMASVLASRTASPAVPRTPMRTDRMPKVVTPDGLEPARLMQTA